jgi:hypothetical protein
LLGIWLFNESLLGWKLIGGTLVFFWHHHRYFLWSTAKRSQLGKYSRQTMDSHRTGANCRTVSIFRCHHR